MTRLTFALAALAAAFVLVAGAAAGRGHGQLYRFSGEYLGAPNANTLAVQVESGNKPALRAMIGASQNEDFSVGSNTEVLIWAHGVPHVGTTASLQQGDYVTVSIRAARGSTLTMIGNTPAATVSDHAVPHASLPEWLFSGTVAGPQSGGRVALHVDSGNWKALEAMLGQPLDQSFAYDDSTIFLLWQGKVPSVIDASQLKSGDRITVRIRAARSASLTQVEATPAAHVGDHEPAPAAQE